MPPAVEGQSPNHWTTREVPHVSHFSLVSVQVYLVYYSVIVKSFIAALVKLSKIFSYLQHQHFFIISS